MKLRLTFLFLMLFLIAATASAQWRLDGTTTGQLRNFRIDQQLGASASAQPSISALKTLRSKLPNDVSIYVVDLRQESHGYVNQIPVSWYEEHNHANDGLSVDAIERDETDRLQSLLNHRETFVPLGKHDIATLKPRTVKVKTVDTERDAASRAGLHYVRFAAADMVFPDSGTVEDFITFVGQLPSNAWLHFHCHAGHGRTTTFLTFYDILKHPDKSLEEIVARQVELGGTDLLATSDGDDWYSQQHRQRAELLREFYRYAHSVMNVTWTDWLNRSLDLEIAPPFDMPLVSINQPLESITILGQPQATQSQMIRLIQLRNPNTKLNCSVADLVRYYYEEAGREGIRADIALCQAIKETGVFNYGGDVDPSQNNYCGLGATGNHVKGAAFDSPRLGARAHIQHLLAYCTTKRPSVDVIDPRYEGASRSINGRIKNWLGLGGVWAVPGTYYGQDILNIWRQALAPDGSNQSIENAARKVKNNPNDPAAHIELAIARFNAGMIEQSLDDYNAAISLKPTVEGYYDRALAYEQLNAFDRAIDDYTAAIEFDPLFPQAWYNRGRAYLIDGQYDAAIADFNHVLELVPQLANAKNNIAVAFIKMNDIEGAANALKDAARINSTNEVVQSNLARLRNYTSEAKAPASMVDRPISWTAKREQLTREYSMKHYGSAWTEIEPQAIVVHWTAWGDIEKVFKYFDLEEDEEGELQVASHFLVARDGEIWRLTPETRLNRHAIGYNWCAIGIENVGGVDGRDDLTAEQLEANVELIRYLHRKYPSIKYVFGHYQQDAARATGLRLELVPDYYAVKPDPGERFMHELRDRLSADGLKFF